MKVQVKWYVVLDFHGEPHETLHRTRGEARDTVGFDRACGMVSHIERREYILINTKRVS